MKFIFPFTSGLAAVAVAFLLTASALPMYRGGSRDSILSRQLATREVHWSQDADHFERSSRSLADNTVQLEGRTSSKANGLPAKVETAIDAYITSMGAKSGTQDRGEYTQNLVDRLTFIFNRRFNFIAVHARHTHKLVGEENVDWVKVSRDIKIGGTTFKYTIYACGEGVIDLRSSENNSKLEWAFRGQYLMVGNHLELTASKIGVLDGRALSGLLTRVEKSVNAYVKDNQVKSTSEDREAYIRSLFSTLDFHLDRKFNLVGMPATRKHEYKFTGKENVDWVKLSRDLTSGGSTFKYIIYVITEGSIEFVNTDTYKDVFRNGHYQMVMNQLELMKR